MTDDTMTLTDEAAEAQKKFKEGIWYAIADGEMLQLTRSEMAMILDEVADSLQAESVSRDGSKSREVEDSQSESSARVDSSTSQKVADELEREQLK